ncbi:RING finger protein 37-like [Mya arenaria]|uniref:RING finger protein 37-like n=1 Tax=Mya arenaria TaxID=6604 RepID=UPI0022E1F65A|nr:RING finger protein 37-like [Mya arenaria]XP_052772756.1 RING finger protein 37-like [Mya arenaria]
MNHQQAVEMLINFCHHSVGTLIKADKVCFDGNEVTNLVSDDLFAKQRGYISDHFVRPPVNITLQFPCNISICRIIIDPVVGQQKSCELKLFTATKVVRESWLYGCQLKCVNTDGLLFNFAGSASQNEPLITCFENKLFRLKGKLAHPDKCFPYNVNLNSRKPGGLTNVGHLTICIQRTKGSKAAAIKTLEVWGIPSNSVPRNIQQQLVTVYTKALSKNNKTGHPEATVTDNDKTPSDKASDDGLSELSKVSTSLELNGIEIPEEFLDSLTLEIMTVPILLPSGKNIDQLTLDKFVNIEASWGRSPSDPFTALPFTANSKPLVNSSLKSRIDAFVLNHSDTLHVPRTLGRANEKRGQAKLQSSRLADFESMDRPVLNVDQTCSTHEQSLEVGNKANATDVDLEPVKCVRRKRKYSATVSKCKAFEETTIPKVCRSESKHKEFDQTGKHTANVSSSGVINQVVEKTVSCKSTHATDLTLSLDSALSSALGSLPSFTSKKSSNSSSNSAPNEDTVNLTNKLTHCAKCQIGLDESSVVKYQLPCGHLLCRDCTRHKAGSDQSKMVCDICSMGYNSSELVRQF